MSQPDNFELKYEHYIHTEMAKYHVHSSEWFQDEHGTNWVKFVPANESIGLEVMLPVRTIQKVVRVS